MKNLMMIGLALASVSAMAQSNAWSSEEKMKMMDAEQPISAKRQIVIKEARTWLSGGDAYEFLGLMDRVATPVDLALTEGLFNANRSALTICEEKIASISPGYTTQYTTTTSDGSVTTTTTTYMAEDWRPMRMVTENSHTKPINYDTALEILTDGQDPTQAGIVSDWWMNQASERQKDIVVRLLTKTAMKANKTLYPSVYSRSAWPQTP